jgi:hypothetical protein
MKTRSKIIFVLVFFSTVFLLSAYTSKPSAQNSSAEVQKPISIGGVWSWQAQKDKHIISDGQFNFIEQNGVIEGTNKVFIPNKFVPGREAKMGSFNEVILPLKGKRDRYKIVFEVYDEKGNVVTSNQAVVTQFGNVMEGKSTQIIKTDKGEIFETKSVGKGNQKRHSLGKSYKFEYTWKATRLP